MLEIRDAVVVITGAASGIGASCAEYWAARGGRLVLADRDEENLAYMEWRLSNAGAEVVTKVIDVSDEEDAAGLARLAIERFGAINLVLPFAGIIRDGMMVSPDRESGQVTRKMSLEDFQAVIDVNLTGVFLTVRECAEQMINSGSRGLICVVSSTGSLGTAGQLNYASSKAAIAVFPKVLTAEFFRRGLGDRLRCVAVAPGYVGTEMVRNMNQDALEGILRNVPIGRLIDPEEVASLVGELYRNEALAGDVFYVHGGLRLGSKG